MLKEAAYKALNGAGWPTWKTVLVERQPVGGLAIRLLPRISPEGREERPRIQLLASLSHDAGVIVGVVIAQMTS